MPELERTDHFDRRFRSKPNQQQIAILKALKFLADNPRHSGLHVERVSSYPGVWSARVNRSDRLTFHWGDDGRIVLRTNCHHDEVYARP
jgi:hypothetical protein